MSNSDPGERILQQTYRTEPQDPRQRELLDVMREMRRLKARKRQLQDILKTGTCEECGTLFARIRTTKRYCSNACGQKASVKHRANAGFDLALIEGVWPILRESGLLTEKVMAIVDQILHGKGVSEAGEYFGLSQQCISLYLQKADRSARLIATIQKLARPAFLPRVEG